MPEEPISVLQPSIQDGLSSGMTKEGPVVPTSTCASHNSASTPILSIASMTSPSAISSADKAGRGGVGLGTGAGSACRAVTSCPESRSFVIRQTKGGSWEGEGNGKISFSGAFTEV